MRCLLSLLFGIGFVTFSCSAMAVEHTKDSLATVRENLDARKAILIDVREKDEWDEGHLKQATLVQLSMLKRAANSEGIRASGVKLPKNKMIYVHCASGFRVLPASKILKGWGFDARPLKAGYDDLVDAGFPAAR